MPHKAPSFWAASDMSASSSRLERILVPVDFSQESRNAIQYALPLAKQFGAKITLLHVVEPVFFCAGYGYGPVARPIADEERIALARAKLKALARTALGPRFPIETAVPSGIGFFEITEAAKALRTGLIILGAHAHGRPGPPLLGSTVEKVVRHASCPVLIVCTNEHQSVL